MRLLAGVGPPAAVAATFLFAWNTVAQWPEAPRTGDTNFGFMPFGASVAGIGLALLGLLVLLARTAAQAVVLAVVCWVVPAMVIYRDDFGAELFPETAKGLTAICAAVSLIPTLLVVAWAAFGRVVPPPEDAGDHPADAGAPVAARLRGQRQLEGADLATVGRPTADAPGVTGAQDSRPTPAGPPPGWYGVPGGPTDELRWWDGLTWTEHTWPRG